MHESPWDEGADGRRKSSLGVVTTTPLYALAAANGVPQLGVPPDAKAAMHEVQEGMKQAGIEFSQAEVSMIAQNEVAIAGSEAESLLKLLDALDDLDDVQKVHTNADIDDQILAEA